MPSAPKILCGVVVSAGKMSKAVKVQTTKQVYNSFFKKHYRERRSCLVSDPNSSLRTGDVVRIADNWSSSKNIKHIVTEIITPFGPAMDERPPIPKMEDLMEEQRQKSVARQERRAERRKEASGEESANDDRAGIRKGPGLKQRHTNVIGGPEVVGGEERVVLESTER